ncbi:hypothetical protein VTN00DRAFT_3019 [Thermoascus crustaceus]|uniref:uncharacterized protein n=1 Tax=Thermoascus crustaceus TaxID=5088 RepID=UPI003742E07A
MLPASPTLPAASLHSNQLHPSIQRIMFWSTIFALLLVYIVRLALCFLRHISLARETGLPYVLLPISEHSIAYLSLFETRFVPYVVNTWLPHGLADYINGSAFKHRWAVKDRLHKKYGGVYMLATPATLTCNVSDASVASQVCMDRRSFSKPVKQYEAVSMYGPSVITCEDSQWSHHRRYTATTFNEKNNALVWQETIRQFFFATRVRIDRRAGGHLEVHPHGFGVKLPFKPAPEATTEDAQGLFKDAITPPPGYHFTFRSVMEYMNRNLASVFVANGILPKWIPRAMLPFFKTDFDAYDDLGNYLHALISAAGVNNETHAHNLLEGLVEREKKKGNVGTDSTCDDPGLSESEILGNLYIFTLAGHETTATTLRFALRQDAQDELYEGILEAARDEPLDPAEWDYTRVFPKLVTPLRWDKRDDGAEGLSGPGLEYASIHRPVRGAFIPFSDGFRACMGKKLAQVEFIAALAVIFREYRVGLARTCECKTEDDTRRRAERALRESSAFLTLTMRDEVPLFFQKRRSPGTASLAGVDILYSVLRPSQKRSPRRLRTFVFCALQISELNGPNGNPTTSRIVLAIGRNVSDTSRNRE